MCVLILAPPDELACRTSAAAFLGELLVLRHGAVESWPRVG
jgi:hypothetical protein